MKGQATLFTHAALIGFSIFLIFTILVTFTNIREQFQEFAADSELKQVCFLVKAAAERAYIQGDYASPSNATHAYIRLNLPDKLAGTAYRIGFANSSVLVETLGLDFSASCRIGFNVTYMGSSGGGPAAVLFTRWPETIELRGA